MKYSEPVVVQFQSDISLRNSSCAKFSCGGVLLRISVPETFSVVRILAAAITIIPNVR